MDQAPPQAPRTGGLGTWLGDQPYVLLTLTMAMWSGNYIAARSVAGHVAPVALAQLRWSLALLILLPFTIRHVRRDWPVVRANWPMLTLFGFLGISLYNTLIYIGVESTTVVNATLLASIFPIIIAATGFAIYRDRLTPAQLVGILIASAGALVVLTKGNVASLTAFEFNPGDLWVLGAQFTWGIYTVLLRERPRVHALTFLTATVCVGQFLLMPFTAWEAAHGGRVEVDFATVAAVLYVAIFAALLAFLCFNRAVELIGSNRTSPFFHLVPVFGSALAVAFLGEHIAIYHAVGWALILAGIAAAQLGRRPVPARHG